MGHLNKQDRHVKRALALDRAMTKVQDKIYALGWDKLDKPIAHGWETQWKLREDVARRADSWQMQMALDVAKMTPKHCDNKKCFKEYKHSEMRYISPEYKIVVKSKKGVKVLITPGTRRIHKHEYDKLHIQAQKWFTEITEVNPWGGREYKIYILRLSFELVPDISRCYITHRQVIDPVLEQEYDELSDEFDKYINDGTMSSRWSHSTNNFRAKRERARWRNAKTEILMGKDPDDLEFVPRLKRGWDDWV